MTKHNEGSCQAAAPEGASAERTTPINPNPETEPTEGAGTYTSAEAEASAHVPLDPPGEASPGEREADPSPDEAAPASQTNRVDAGPTPQGGEQAPHPAESPEGIISERLPVKERAAIFLAARKAKKAAETKHQGERASRVGKKNASARKGEKAKPESSSTPESDTHNSTLDPELIKEEMLAEPEKIDQNQGNTVVNQVVIARRIDELQQACKGDRNWTKHVETLDYDSRTARGLQELGECQWGENGTPRSEILARLRLGLQEIVKLCSLPLEPLEDNVGREDLKKVASEEIGQEIRVILGKPEPKRKPRPGTLDKVVESFARFVSKKVTSLEKLDRNAIDVGEVQTRFREAVDDAFAKLAATHEPASGAELAAHVPAVEPGPRLDPRPRDDAVATAPQP